MRVIIYVNVKFQSAFSSLSHLFLNGFMLIEAPETKKKLFESSRMAKLFNRDRFVEKDFLVAKTNLLSAFQPSQGFFDHKMQQQLFF